MRGTFSQKVAWENERSEKPLKNKMFIFPNMLGYDEDDPEGDCDLTVLPGKDTTPELAAVIEAEDFDSAVARIEKIAISEVQMIYNAPARIANRPSKDRFILEKFNADDDYDYEMTVVVDNGYDSFFILIGLQCS